MLNLECLLYALRWFVRKITDIFLSSPLLIHPKLKKLAQHSRYNQDALYWYNLTCYSLRGPILIALLSKGSMEYSRRSVYLILNNPQLSQ